jgi:outer membrane receptor for ferrienterochelin and colicins
MYRSILQVAILVLLSVCAQAQTLRFTVLEKESRQPVELAYVNVYELPNNAIQNTVQTDVNGIAEVRLEKYPCRVEIALQGYEKYSKEFLAPPVNATPTITLTKKFSSLDEVVVTGVSQPVKLKNALSSYRVIPRSLIQARGAVALDEALKNQLNISVGQDPILGGNIQMQGMDGNKVKILIDGMPVIGREGGNINLNQINMNNVDRVEIIQGPMSVVYGTDAVGGVINVITRKEHKKMGARINTYYESIGKYNLDGTFTYRLGNRNQFTLRGGRNYFDGAVHTDIPIYSGKYSYQTNRSFYFKPVEQYIGNVAYTYTAPSQFKLDFASDLLKEKITNKGSLKQWSPFGASAIDEFYYTSRAINRVGLQGKIGKTGNWQSQSSYALYHRIRTKVVTDMVTMEMTPTKSKGDQDTTLFQTVTTRGSYNNHWNKLKYTVGYDINLDFGKSLKVDSGFAKHMQDYAVYGSASYAFFKDKLTVQGGLRAAKNTVYDVPLIPSLNLLFAPLNKLQLRASYSEGFRAPSIKELYLQFYDVNHDITGNKDLAPEKGRHMQLSASYQAYEKQSDYLQFIVTGFYNDVINGIVLVPVVPNAPLSNKYKYDNLSRQSNVIGNVQMDGQWNNFHLQLGYSYRHTFEQKGQYNAFNASEGNAMLQYSWSKPGVNFNFFYRFSGPQIALITGVDGSPLYNGDQKAYGIADASIQKKLLKSKLQITAGMKNIFNLQRTTVSGMVVANGAGSVHGGSGGGTVLMPRSFYTSLNLNID